MSRHRLVRNMSIEDELADTADDYYSEDYSDYSDDEYDDGYDQYDSTVSAGKKATAKGGAANVKGKTTDKYIYNRNAGGNAMASAIDAALATKGGQPKGNSGGQQQTPMGTSGAGGSQESKSSGSVNLVDHISSILGPDFPRGQIKQALADSSYDVDSAVDALLNVGPADASDFLELENDSSSSSADITSSQKGNYTSFLHSRSTGGNSYKTTRQQSSLSRKNYTPTPNGLKRINVRSKKTARSIPTVTKENYFLCEKVLNSKNMYGQFSVKISAKSGENLEQNYTKTLFSQNRKLLNGLTNPKKDLSAIWDEDSLKMKLSPFKLLSSNMISSRRKVKRTFQQLKDDTVIDDIIDTKYSNPTRLSKKRTNIALLNTAIKTSLIPGDTVKIITPAKYPLDCFLDKDGSFNFVSKRRIKLYTPKIIDDLSLKSGNVVNIKEKSRDNSMDIDIQLGPQISFVDDRVKMEVIPQTDNATSFFDIIDELSQQQYQPPVHVVDDSSMFGKLMVNTKTIRTFSDLLDHIPHNTLHEIYTDFMGALKINPEVTRQKKFNFDTPSPDDLILAALNKATGSETNSPSIPKRNYTPIIKVSKGPKVPKQQASNQPTSRQPKYKDLQTNKIQKSLSELSISKLDKSPSGLSINKLGNASSNESIGSNKVPVITKAQKARRVDVLEEYKKSRQPSSDNGDGVKQNINLVVVGHVDAGKSTLMGHTLFLLGEVSERLLRKYEKESENLKKGSFSYAWVLDETEEERSRGVTIDIAMSSFQTPHRKFTLLDAPGHRDFVPNMISGASQADAAVLVVDATSGSFESGFDNGGQTREHAILVRSLGIQQLIVAVNKLDTCGYSKERFDSISDTLTQFLTTKVGFKKSNIHYVPVSGFGGENIVKKADEKLSAWYKGPTFVERLDLLEPVEKNIDSPFRLSVTDIFRAATHLGGVTVTGRIESGHVQISDVLRIVPTDEHVQIKAIAIDGKTGGNNSSDYTTNDEETRWAVAGDSVQLNIGNIDPQQLYVGSVLCDPQSPIPLSAKFKTQIVTFDTKFPLTIGVPIVAHHQSVTEPGTISQIEALLDKTTGEVVRKSPRAVPKNSTATVVVTLQRPICLDTFKNSKDFGRILLRVGTETVAAGIILEIL